MVKILAIDDQLDNLITLQAVMKSMRPSYRVITAQSGVEGIEMARQEQPDCIFLDIIMPHLNGYEVCQRLKSDPLVRHIPVIMLTAIKTDSESRVKGLQIGADSFLPKPIDPPELIAQLEVMLRIKKAEDELRKEKLQVEIQVEKRTKSLRESNERLQEEIKKRKELESQLRMLYRAVEQSPTSILITDIEGRIEYVNHRLLSLTGFKQEEIIGRYPRIFQSGKTRREVYKKLWDTITTGGTWTGQLLNRKKNGELYWENAIISPVFDPSGKTINYLAIKEDVTESKRIKQELVAALNKAKESDRLKTAFLANMSHEIRTPMNGIVGFAELLKTPNLPKQEQYEFLEIIQKSSYRLLGTVNDIIEISKIESGGLKIKKQDIDLFQHLTNHVNFFTQEAKNKGIEIRIQHKNVPNELIYRTDKTKLSSIISNLIKNAIKFTDSGLIQTGFFVENNYLCFYCNDTGIGIPKSRLDAIFNRFEQADIEDAKALQGSGLGLSIVKSYVELLHGKIEVDSELGKGSSFKITFPYKP